jgi:hypothetical protein
LKNHIKIKREIVQMSRTPFTEEEKQKAKIQRNIKNKLWQLANKTKYDEYLRSYYQVNKSRLNAQRTANRKKLRERQQLESAEMVVDNVVS